MSEATVIERTPYPNTRETLEEDLRRLGVKKGATFIVHSSMSRIGWVNGGELAAVQALMDAVSEEGTIVMPTHTGGLSDPAEWGNPPVPEAWWETIRATMPAFDPAVTPTRGMGRIVECFRTMPGVLRSNHPHTSFAAWGANAEQITRSHGLRFGMGEQSPLARIYEMDGSVLLLGVGYDNNTSFHLAEYRTPSSKTATKYAPIFMNGERVWQAFDEIDFRTDDFEELGSAFESSGADVQTGNVGQAPCKLFSQRDCVDFAVKWLEAHPQQT